jgi:putative protease
MHIFNSRELCLLETLPYLTEAGPGVLRIEARREDERYVQKAMKAYRRALDGLYRNFGRLPELTAIMRELTEGGPGYTRGHYYRGVLD